MIGLPIIILIVLGVFILYVWFLYNDLVTSRLQVKEAWSQIDVQLKRRTDLIPNLVETVKGYAKHEKQVLENITKARSALLSATSPKDKAQANNMLADALKTLFAVAENYPKLVANENFLHLQKELSDTEDKVAYSRQFYNTTILNYNTKLQVFPNVVIARNLGFSPEEFFQTSDEERKNVKVKFD